MEHDPIIEAAKRDLAELDARRRDIADFIERYIKYKGLAPTSSTQALVAHVADDALACSKLRSPPSDKVMSAVHDILSKRGDALTLSAIFDALAERGVIIGGKHPKQNLSQKLSAHPQLKSYGKRGWYFADTIPPCLQPSRQLSEEGSDYEEGLLTEVTRPLHLNGETGSYPV